MARTIVYMSTRWSRVLLVGDEAMGEGIGPGASIRIPISQMEIVPVERQSHNVLLFQTTLIPNTVDEGSINCISNRILNMVGLHLVQYRSIGAASLRGGLRHVLPWNSNVVQTSIINLCALTGIFVWNSSSAMRVHVRDEHKMRMLLCLVQRS